MLEYNIETYTRGWRTEILLANKEAFYQQSEPGEAGAMV
jgi:hypothetical protein